MTAAFFKIRKRQIFRAGISGFQVPACFCCCQRLLGQSRNDRLPGTRKAVRSPGQSRQHQGAASRRLSGPELFAGWLKDAGGVEIGASSYTQEKSGNIPFPPVPFGSSSFNSNVFWSKRDLLSGESKYLLYICKGKKINTHLIKIKTKTKLN